MTKWDDLPPDFRERLRAGRARNREEAKASTRMLREHRRRLPKTVHKSLTNQPVWVLDLLEACRRIQFALDRGPLRHKWSLSMALRVAVVREYDHLRQELDDEIKRRGRDEGLESIREFTGLKERNRTIHSRYRSDGANWC